MDKVLKYTYRLLGIGVLVLLLAAIRLFEDQLFYDPLIQFYRSDYLIGIIPRMDMALLMLHLAFRFALNTIISLGIIYLSFKDLAIIRFSALLYGLLYVLATGIFIFLVLHMEREHYLALFYVRRFLIHPVFLLILLPAFYYYHLARKRKS